MENVTIVGTEAGVLILATESGARFALPIDDVLRTEIRRAQQQSEPTAARMAASPRDIQMHIRAGLTATEVAELLGVSIDDVIRFETPILAEREHIIGQALAVPVLIGSEVEPDAQPTFGTAIRGKLADIAATNERWASWKEESGWIVKLEFSASDVDHDARWSYDPRRSALAPLNADATQLSRQGSLPEGLIPRLRAVESEAATSPYKDDSRFDSGAFGPRLLPNHDAETEDSVVPERASSAVQDAATKRAPDRTTTGPETADLLETLRRRRGQRESTPLIDFDDDREYRDADDGRDAPIALFDPLDSAEEPSSQEAAPNQGSDSGARRGRRNAMPSWDEIVFGARTDE